ncbi:DUF4158 domain-containing protein [Streptomyces xiangluensis]|uniref:DUF4158 domain-containing protein n=1 Tax=Streptomyces xiangluensis TaxID=2665720 RepID=A0ABV8Z5Y0_9ACTN
MADTPPEPEPPPIIVVLPDGQEFSKGRRSHNRLGWAVQWGTVRMLGTFLSTPADVPPGVAAFVAEQLETGGEMRGPLTGHRVSPRPSSHGNCAVQADKVFRVRLPHVGPEAFLDHGEPEVAPLR